MKHKCTGEIYTALKVFRANSNLKTSLFMNLALVRRHNKDLRKVIHRAF